MFPSRHPRQSVSKQKDDDGDEERRLALADRDERGRDHPEGDEREPVQDRVADDRAQCDGDAGRSRHS